MATIKERKADIVRKKKVNPLDNARNPNFDAAMAQRNYANSMAQERARMEAEQGQFTEGRLMGAPQNQSQQGFQDEIARRNTLLGYNNQTYGSYANQPAQQGFGDVAGAMSSAGQLPSQQQFDPNAPNLMPIGEFSPEQMQNLSPERRMAVEQRMGAQQGENMAGIPMDGQPIRPNSAMGQMKDYNKILQQGMQRNQDMNRAVQNFAE